MWRKDVTALQKKLTQVTQDSLAKSSDLQDRLLEARGSYVETVQKLKTAEEAAKRLEEKAEQSSVSVLDNSLATRLQQYGPLHMYML